MRTHRLLLTGCLLAAIGGMTSCNKGSDVPKAVPGGTQVTVMFAGNNIGEIEPCG